jgi:hypothetical protein
MASSRRTSHVLEDKKVMTPQSFEEYRSAPLSPSAPVQPKLDLGPNVFTNYTVKPQNGPLNVLVLDALNTPVANQADVQRQMLEFVKTMPEGSRIAIFGLSTRLFMLQGFTADSALLKAALTGKKNLPKKSALLATPQDAQDQQDQLDSIAAMGDGHGNPAIARAGAAVSDYAELPADLATCSLHVGRTRQSGPVSCRHVRAQEPDLVLGLLSAEYSAGS